MNDDKKNRCYICGKDRAAVNIYFYYSYKKLTKTLMIISGKNISYGITFFICIVFNKNPKQNLVV